MTAPKGSVRPQAATLISSGVGSLSPQPTLELSQQHWEASFLLPASQEQGRSALCSHKRRSCLEMKLVQRNGDDDDNDDNDGNNS